MARTTPGTLVVLVTLLGLATALPRHAPALASTPAAAPTPPNFVGEATNEIATLMLQGFADKDRNVAFSPLGYSALLAQLAEGARGRTREQLAMVLHLPDDTGAVRAAYKEVLLRLREKNVVNKPELRTWFYVYKNHSVEPEYKDILKEYYLTEVKSVARPTEALGFSPSGETEQSQTPIKQNLAQSQLQGTEEGEASGAELEDAMALGAMKEGVLIETALQEEAKRLMEEKKKAQALKMKEEQATIEHIRDGQQTPEKMEEEMKDQVQEQAQVQEQTQDQSQMSEQIQEDQSKDQQMTEEEQMKDEQTQQSDMIMNEQAQETTMNEQLTQGTMKEDKPMKEQIQQEQIQQSSQMEEVMMATSKRRKLRTVQREAEAEVGAALGLAAAPAASQTLNDGVSANFDKVNNGSSARMLLFNGMYYRGSWSTPFKSLSQPQPFYLTPERKIAVPAMTARGDFRLGRVPELDADAIELPYEGGRYALLVLVPRTAGGLRGLVADLAGFSLSALTGSLQRQTADVTLPCFAVETITRPIPTFVKAGVRDVFTAGDADLSGVCADGALYVQDLVQLVTLRVDDASSAANHLTSSALESRTEPQEKLTIDKPFVYFVRDVVDNIVMVAGKVVNPEEKPTPYA